jgi:phage terminase large subunit GpA-like protein
VSELLTQLTTTARAAFLEDWEADFAPRVKRSVNQCAIECRIVGAGTSPLAPHDIPYARTAHLFPHLPRVMDSVDEPGIRIVAYWGARRDGKTDLSKNIIIRTVLDDPGNIYDIHPREDDAALYSEQEIEPLIELCMPRYFVPKKSRDSGRTIEFKKFKGGYIRIFSAESSTKFHGTSVPVVLIHELDKTKKESIEKAFGRTTGFPNAIIYVESTGTFAAEINAKTGEKIYRSNIESVYDMGDKQNWFCQCRACGLLQRLYYEQIQPLKDKPEKAFYLCARCGADHDARQWRDMAAGGDWFPTAGLSETQLKDIEHTHHLATPLDSTVRSFWRNCYASLLPHHEAYESKLHEFLALGQAAMKGTIEKRIIWTQEDKAELWNPEGEGETPPAWKPIFDRREEYGLTVPQQGLFLTAFVDVHLNRLETGWRVFGREEESWGMDHTVTAGNVHSRETWRALALELTRPWKHASGKEIRLGMAFIDGGKWPDEVYNFFVMIAAFLNGQHPLHMQALEFFKDISPACIQQLSGHVRAAKGMGQHGHAIVNRKMQTVGKVLKGHHVGTWGAKDRIYERLRLENNTNTGADSTLHSIGAGTNSLPGFMHYNKRYQEEFFQQLTCEQVTIAFLGGEEVRKYDNPKRLRNEALDIEVGCLAALHLHTQNFDALAEQLAPVQAAPQPQQIQQPQPKVPQQTQRSKGGSWVTKGLKW